MIPVSQLQPSQVSQLETDIEQMRSLVQRAWVRPLKSWERSIYWRYSRDLGITLCQCSECKRRRERANGG